MLYVCMHSHIGKGQNGYATSGVEPEPAAWNGLACDIRALLCHVLLDMHRMSARSNVGKGQAGHPAKRCPAGQELTGRTTLARERYIVVCRTRFRVSGWHAAHANLQSPCARAGLDIRSVMSASVRYRGRTRLACQRAVHSC